MKFGVIIFPGSNCDHDAFWVVSKVAKQPVTFLWHDSSDLQGCDAIIVPGGFAYGDYLRCGAMASLSPVMTEVKAAADRGVAVAGICNGFQVLCEARMLPGALLRNAGLKYVCEPVDLEIVNTQTRFTARYRGQREARMTIGHGEGNFFAEDETLDRLEGEGQVVFRYRSNPNGSARDIAGIVNDRGNVLGMMPHPDRAFEEELGSADGALFFQSVLASA